MLKLKSINIALLINGLEYYCLSLYGFFSLYLTPVFFPTLDPFLANIASLTTFSMGFLMNPVGGIVFGYIGDNYGRKPAIILSILLTTVPTLIIGLLPSFETVGLLSPLTLMLCRLLQGFAVGGQAYGNVIFVMEHSRKGKVNLACSILAASSLLGALTGTVLGTIVLDPAIKEWGWRLPFLLGGGAGLMIYFLRANLQETEKASKLVPLAYSLKLLLTKHTKILTAVILISAASTVPFYFFIIYAGNIIIPARFNLSSSTVMSFTTCMLLSWILFLPINGYLADKLNCGAFLMKSSSLLLSILAFPFLWILTNIDQLSIIYSVQVIMNFLSAAFVATSSNYIANLFGPSLRCLGVSIAASLGTCLFASTAPIISETLVHYTGISMSPAFYLATCSFMGLLGLVLTRKNIEDIFPVEIRQTMINQLKNTLKSNKNGPLPTLNKYGYMLTNSHEYSQAFIDFAALATSPVLDIGTTYGFTTLRALEKGAHVIANDLDSRHLAVLKEITPLAYLSQLKIIAGKIPNDIDFPPNSLEAINASGVLHFLISRSVRSLDG